MCCKQAKCLAKLRLPSRKVSTKLRGIISDYPTIGKEIENFVEERNAGADKWRQTGASTFDGNQEVTYKRIWKHLQVISSPLFIWYCIVQLCMARNKRRKSAKNYYGVAKAAESEKVFV